MDDSDPIPSRFSDYAKDIEPVAHTIKICIP
jgi:hypothetical protein